MPNKITIPAIFLFLLICWGISLAGNQGSISVSNLPLFGLCCILAFIIQWVIFIPSYIFKTEHFFDLTGSLTFLSLVILSLLLTTELYFRDLVIALFIVIWASRLGTFLFKRVNKDGGDGRFTVMKTQFFWFLMTWTIQGAWVFITLSAALAAISSQEKVEADLYLLIGSIIWAIGFVIEVIADSQKTKFRSYPENKDKFISSGIWSWSRHPNYFGEIFLWFGISVIAFPVLSGWQYVTLISPLFVILLLTQISGVRLLELRGKKKWGNDEEYNSYLKQTSVLIPFPPKKN